MSSIANWLTVLVYRRRARLASACIMQQPPTLKAVFFVTGLQPRSGSDTPIADSAPPPEHLATRAPSYVCFQAPLFRRGTSPMGSMLPVRRSRPERLDMGGLRTVSLQPQYGIKRIL